MNAKPLAVLTGLLLLSSLAMAQNTLQVGAKTRLPDQGRWRNTSLSLEFAARRVEGRVLMEGRLTMEFSLAGEEARFVLQATRHEQVTDREGRVRVISFGALKNVRTGRSFDVRCEWYAEDNRKESDPPERRPDAFGIRITRPGADFNLIGEWNHPGFSAVNIRRS